MKSPFSGDFQGLWEAWETNSFIVSSMLSIRPSFPPLLRPCFRFEVWSVNSSRCLLVSDFLAVGHDLRLVLEVLLRFNKRECMAKAFVLDDGSMADALVLTEDTIGK